MLSGSIGFTTVYTGLPHSSKDGTFQQMEKQVHGFEFLVDPSPAFSRRPETAHTFIW